MVGLDLHAGITSSRGRYAGPTYPGSKICGAGALNCVPSEHRLCCASDLLQYFTSSSLLTFYHCFSQTTPTRFSKL